MSKTTTLWVLWISLLLLLPLPILSEGGMATLPVAYLFQVSIKDWVLLELLQGALWALVLWLLAQGYIQLAGAWESKIRGSVMAIVVLSLLILFSSIPIYKNVPRHGGQLLTFQWLYE